MLDFSLVTVCYNSAKTLERTINSVLKQDYKSYEYIIIDGGSNDGTIDLIMSYEKVFEGRLSWISEPDRGIYDAFNKGIKRANGLYIWLINSDDYIEPHALSDIHNNICNYESKYPVISGAMNVRGVDGNIEYKSVSSATQAKKAYNMDDIGIKHPATLIPKQIYEEVGLYDERFHIVGDMDWFQRAYKIGVPFLFLNNVLTNMQNDGISNTYTYKVYKMRCEDMRLLFSKKFENKFQYYLHYYRWNIRIIARFLKHIII